MRKRISLSSSPIVNVPHPSFDEWILLCIEDALREAWCRLCARVSKADLLVADEASLTNGLRDELVNLWGNPPENSAFNQNNFTMPQKGTQFENFDGSVIEQTPDLTIYPNRDRTGLTQLLYDAIFVECKIIDDTGLAKTGYGVDGILRFVDGNYAWAVQDGMMVGYVYCSGKLPDTLHTHIEWKGMRTKYRVIAGTKVEVIDSGVLPVSCATQHYRVWKHKSGSNAGQLGLRHLWLHVP